MAEKTEQLKIMAHEKQFFDDSEFYNDDGKLVEFICHDCDFFKPDEKILECFAFKIVKNLLRKRVVSPQEVLDALR
ncbi:MAG: hypothetical protein SCH39_11915 [Methanosarcinales archaeon]|nr:hypothetical protein [ANME-2 cluster archaeon]MDF1530769.1 hypothetical protein [ANME-2 cluster archaeon]MDW7777019.1 hypothetical protein [Methanosarcinales archaeon]